MKRFVRSAVLVVLVSQLGLSHAAYSAAQNLLTNGSFELPELADNTSLIVAPDDWSVVTPPSVVNGVVLANTPLAQEGEQFIGIGVEGNGSPNTVFQEVSIPSAGLYRLSWYATTSLGFGTTSPYSVIVEDADSTIASETFEAFSGSLDWFERELFVSLAAGNHTFTFQPEPPAGRVASLIDNVRLLAVPEPTSLILMSLVLASTTVFRRNRR